MSTKHLLRTVSAAALLATALAAQAGTVTFTGYTHGNGNAVNVTSPGYNGAAGGYKGTLAGFGGGFDGAFESFCVDLGEFFSFGPTYNSYTLVSAVSQFGAAKTAALSQLISHVYGSNLFAAAGDKDQQSTAVQLAIWNIVYDSDFTLNSGSFAETTTAYRSTAGVTPQFIGANNLLSASQSAQRGPSYELYVLRSVGNPGNQDQLIWRQSVPEPASLALVALALGAAGFASRRRRS
ncbi:MAG: PEP-CTERM sorting domain-containing protein [Rubrivivax sp.]|nr:PEP-CTERM sorting domain-containing protein [Rubrivivax sp.]